MDQFFPHCWARFRGPLGEVDGDDIVCSSLIDEENKRPEYCSIGQCPSQPAVSCASQEKEARLAKSRDWIASNHLNRHDSSKRLIEKCTLMYLFDASATVRHGSKLRYMQVV